MVNSLERKERDFFTIPYSIQEKLKKLKTIENYEAAAQILKRNQLRLVALRKKNKNLSFYFQDTPATLITLNHFLDQNFLSTELINDFFTFLEVEKHNAEGGSFSYDFVFNKLYDACREVWKYYEKKELKWETFYSSLGNLIFASHAWTRILSTVHRNKKFLDKKFQIEST